MTVLSQRGVPCNVQLTNIIYACVLINLVRRKQVDYSWCEDDDIDWPRPRHGHIPQPSDPRPCRPVSTASRAAAAGVTLPGRDQRATRVDLRGSGPVVRTWTELRGVEIMNGHWKTAMSVYRGISWSYRNSWSTQWTIKNVTLYFWL